MLAIGFDGFGRATAPILSTLRMCAGLTLHCLCGSKQTSLACSYCRSAVCDGCGADGVCPFCYYGTKGAKTLRPIQEQDRGWVTVQHEQWQTHVKDADRA